MFHLYKRRISDQLQQLTASQERHLISFIISMPVHYEGLHDFNVCLHIVTVMKSGPQRQEVTVG
jgi:hypothetical protein